MEVGIAVVVEATAIPAFREDVTSEDLSKTMKLSLILLHFLWGKLDLPQCDYQGMLEACVLLVMVNPVP